MGRWHPELYPHYKKYFKNKKEILGGIKMNKIILHKTIVDENGYEEQVECIFSKKLVGLYVEESEFNSLEELLDEYTSEDVEGIECMEMLGR